MTTPGCAVSVHREVGMYVFVLRAGRRRWCKRPALSLSAVNGSHWSNCLAQSLLRDCIASIEDLQ